MEIITFAFFIYAGFILLNILLCIAGVFKTGEDFSFKEFLSAIWKPIFRGPFGTPAIIESIRNSK